MNVTGLKLAYTDLLKDADGGDAASLSAMVTDRQEEVLARQDKDATVYAVRARSAANLQKAAEALRSGRRDEAQRLIQQNQALSRGRPRWRAPRRWRRTWPSSRPSYDDYEQAQSDEAVSTAVKRSKTKALKDFGELGSTY